MKKTLLFLMLVFITTSVFCQFRQAQMGQKIYIKLITTPGIEVTPIAKEVAVNGYFSESVLINNKTFVGLAGSITLNGLNYTTPENKTYPLDFYVCGFTLGRYIWQKHRKLEPCFSIFTGAGMAQIDKYITVGRDFFVMVMPEVSIEQKLSESTKLSLGVYYRFTNGLNQLIPNEDLTNLGVRLSLKFEYY
jgi:hypothetical protein